MEQLRRGKSKYGRTYGSVFLKRPSLVLAALIGFGLLFCVNAGARADILYVSNDTNGGDDSINEYNSATGAESVFTYLGTQATPYGLAISNGYLYVSEAGFSYENILKISLSTGNSTVFASGLNGPGSIAISNGYLYTLNTNTSQFLKFSLATGAQSVLASYTGFSIGDNFAIYNGSLYSTEEQYGHIEAISLSTGVSSEFEGGLNDPNGLAIDGNGNLYVPEGNEVLEYSIAAGAFSSGSVFESGLGGGDLAAVGSSGLYTISEGGNDTIYNIPFATGTPSFLSNTGLNSPQDVAVLPVPEPSCLRLILPLCLMFCLFGRSRLTRRRFGTTLISAAG